MSPQTAKFFTNKAINLARNVHRQREFVHRPILSIKTNGQYWQVEITVGTLKIKRVFKFQWRHFSHLILMTSLEKKYFSFLDMWFMTLEIGAGWWETIKKSSNEFVTLNEVIVWNNFSSICCQIQFKFNVGNFVIKIAMERQVYKINKI